MAKAYLYRFEVNGNEYFAYAESQLAAEEQIRYGEFDDNVIKFIDRAPF